MSGLILLTRRGHTDTGTWDTESTDCCMKTIWQLRAGFYHVIVLANRFDSPNAKL